MQLALHSVASCGNSFRLDSGGSATIIGGALSSSSTVAGTSTRTSYSFSTRSTTTSSRQKWDVAVVPVTLFLPAVANIVIEVVGKSYSSSFS